MPESVDVCVIDDASASRDSLIAKLRDEGYAVVTADDGRAGLEIVRKHQPRVVLCDWRVGDLGGPEVCRMLQADTLTADSHIILLADQYDSAACAECLAAGGDDLVGRDRPFDELISRIRVGLRMWNLQTDLKRAAITDALTGLHNHRHFVNALDSEFSRSRRYGGRLALILADLDHFKAVNDTYGHQVGDMVLRQIGRALGNAVREPDTVARYGGEEFAVIVPEATLSQAEDLAERLRLRVASLDGPEELHGQQVTASFGVASDEDSQVTTPSSLVELADQALYAAKRAGRNRVITSAQLSQFNHIIAHDPGEVEKLRREVASLGAQAKENFVQSIYALVQALEARDRYTARHSRNVTFFSEHMARNLGLSPALTRSIRLAAMLHDVGKIGVPDRVLMKPGALTEEERATLRSVPQLSAKIVDHMRILQTELPMIRHQHENYDGTGYPMGLAGEQIPIGARIIHVAEAFDSLTSDRVFRPSRSIEEALEEIKRNEGTQFDPRVVRALHDCVQQSGESIREHIASSRQALLSGATTANVDLLND